MPSAPIAVVGAGIAGLVAASELRRNGYSVIVFEAGKQVAGLASSQRDDEGFTYDTGAHFITNRLANALGVGAVCRDVRYYRETVWLAGKTYAYPLGLARVPRFAASALATKVRRRGPAVSAGDWFRAEYGAALADEVALPLIEAWSGAPASDLSPAVGDKIPGGIAQTVALRLASRLTHRAVAIGYCREMPQSWKVWHVYPEKGVSTLCEELATELRAQLRVESPVQRITIDDGRAVAVRVDGREIEVRAVISTAPVNVLPRMVEGGTALDRFRQFRFRPMIFINLRLEGRGLLPDVVTWTPEDRFPFFRLTETPLSMPWVAPTGKTLVIADIGAEVGDEHWVMDDEALGRYCVEHLVPIIPDIRRRYRGSRVIRTPIAYPVFLRAYEAERQDLERSTGVENLLSIGRNGEFAHILMEDVYWRTLRRIRSWMAQQAQPLRASGRTAD